MVGHRSHERIQVGIVGAGQLARMTVQAAIPLDIRLRVLAERPDDGAALVAPDVVIGSPKDGATLAAFAASCDVLTFDHELVPGEHLAALDAGGHTLRPSAATMAIAQDKRRQREELGRRGLPVPPFGAVAAAEDVAAFAAEHGWPVVVKAARGGYDGRGVWVVQDAAALEVISRLIAAGGDLLVEQWLPIEREVAILVARRPNGEIVVYPLVETVQVDGICRETVVPAPVSPDLATAAAALAREIAVAVDVVGVLAVELFVVGDRLLVNELAARPHNSGHCSIEGCVTSQFEQHLRAILDWPLGSTALTAPAVVTVNVLGGPTAADPIAELPKALAIAGVHVHLYGKATRPGRKLGHVTVCDTTVDEARRRAREAAAILSGTAPVVAPR